MVDRRWIGFRVRGQQIRLSREPGRMRRTMCKYHAVAKHPTTDGCLCDRWLLLRQVDRCEPGTWQTIRSCRSRQRPRLLAWDEAAVTRGGCVAEQAGRSLRRAPLLRSDDQTAIRRPGDACRIQLPITGAIADVAAGSMLVHDEDGDRIPAASAPIRQRCVVICRSIRLAECRHYCRPWPPRSTTSLVAWRHFKGARRGWLICRNFHPTSCSCRRDSRLAKCCIRDAEHPNSSGARAVFPAFATLAAAAGAQSGGAAARAQADLALPPGARPITNNARTEGIESRNQLVVLPLLAPDFSGSSDFANSASLRAASTTRRPLLVPGRWSSHHAGLDRYFITADAAEITLLDTGVTTGWARTGQSIRCLCFNTDRHGG